VFKGLGLGRRRSAKARREEKRKISKLDAELLRLTRRRRGVLKGTLHDLAKGKIFKGRAGLLMKCAISRNPRTIAKLFIVASPHLMVAGCIAGVDPRKLADNAGKVVKQAAKNMVGKYDYKRGKKMAKCLAKQAFKKYVPKVAQAIIKNVIRSKAAKKVIKGVLKVGKKNRQRCFESREKNRKSFGRLIL